jgi:hypothetical protein
MPKREIQSMTAMLLLHSDAGLGKGSAGSYVDKIFMLLISTIIKNINDPKHGAPLVLFGFSST